MRTRPNTSLPSPPRPTTRGAWTRRPRDHQPLAQSTEMTSQLTKHSSFLNSPAPHSEYTDSHVTVEATRHEPYSSPIDIAEREYRERFRPSYHQNEVDVTVSQPQYAAAAQYQSEYIPQEYPDNAAAPARFTSAYQKSKMGYYDEEGHYHSFRQGVHKLADKLAHPIHHDRRHVDVDVDVEVSRGPARRAPPGESAASYIPNTVTIPCHHIHIGDYLMLQGRPCQVIRISTSSATGQYRYLGVDIFTKQMHEESSYVSNPAPSVVVQTMLGPIMKQYRVLDIQAGSVVAMTETGDVKQHLPVGEQSNLYARLTSAFDSGRGSVRVLVLNDNGRELAVDMKVVHGSRI